MASYIKNIFPLGFPWQTQDPFLFCVHHLDFYPKGNEKMGPATSLEGRNIGNDFKIQDGWRMYHGSKVPGFPYHPHRGFETITIAEQGYVDHTDSMGGAGRFGKGDVQWMTAGKGILHSEMFPLIKTESENTLEIFQIWLNLPAKSKFVEPHFKMLWKNDIAETTLIDHNQRKCLIRSLTGNLFGVESSQTTPDSWASDPNNHVAVATISLDSGAICDIPKIEQDINRTLYFYSGDELTIGEKTIQINHGVELDSKQSNTITAGQKPCKVLVLQGKPINEPVAQHGPFVMNSQQEIMDAFAEYRETKFGGWPWPNEEHVHDREKGRFALHSDGTEENPL